MKIKREVEMNLPQLIEWAWDNDDATGVRFQSDGFVTTVYFGKNGDVSVEDCSKDARFTVEVEEEITEDTKLPKSLAIFEHNGNLYSEMHDNKNINDILKMDIKVKSSSTKTIHMVNDDGTHTLIWRDGKLVD